MTSVIQNFLSTKNNHIIIIAVTIPFIDLKTQYQRHKESFDTAISNVLEHGQYIMGPEVTLLETKLAEYIGVKHALSCSSGTDALLLALMTQELTENDAVFTTPFTFFASAEAISLSGATPVFVDIDPNTYNIDPDSLEQEIVKVQEAGKLTPKGILPVDLFGLAADYQKIKTIADKHKLFILEDAAQSFGAFYHGSKACSFGDIGATSFYPAKPLGCYGDGGAVFTNNTELYNKMVSLRVHGQAASANKYDNERIGLNARMDTIQASVLIEKLKVYDDELKSRQQVADLYAELLDDSIKKQIIPNGQRSVWAQYSIESYNRDLIRAELSKADIPTAVFYPTPIHLSTAYKYLRYSEGDFPVCESISNRIFSLPMHPYLEQDQIELICSTVNQYATHTT